MSKGHSTSPIEDGIDAQIQEVADLWDVGTVRDSDEADLPPIANQLGAKICETYFVGCGDRDWIKAHPQGCPQFFLMSQQCLALDT